MGKTEYPYQNLSLKDMEGEKWKDIPGHEDCYQVSNYGRFKALERWVERAVKGDLHLPEKILKQTTVKLFNRFTKERVTKLHISLCRYAKKESVTPGRIVYYLFVKRFNLDDPTLVVVPKNGDFLNNKYTNLRLGKKSEVQVKTYKNEKKRRPVKPVSQYDYQGNLIKTYPSIVQAAAETGYSVNYISQAANGHFQHCFGWVWRFGLQKKIRAIKFPYKNVRRIAQLTPDGKLVREFSSITEAEQLTGYDDIGITNAAKKRRDFYKGFIWKYID